MKIKRDTIARLREEYEFATTHFRKYNSFHEGYAVIKEELDELWDEIKSKERTLTNMRKEAIQVAVTAIRFIQDLG